MSSDEEDSSERVAIGISFGNSYSSIACTISGDAKVIANEEGDRQIPSILSYVEGEEFHGTQAKAQLVRNPKDTVVCFRDFLGKNFDSIDPTPCHNSAHPQPHDSTVAFSVHDTDSDTPSVLTVSEITTRHLRRLASSASDYLGKTVTSAVITVPNDFGDAQKAALIDAARAAGLEVLQLIPEPVASLLAHDRRTASSPPADKLVLVAELGATRSDASLVSIKGGMYSILATAHDYSLGGATLDAVLVEHFAKEFLKKHKTASDPRQAQRGMAKLQLECEATKKALSLGTSAGFTVESLSDGLDFSSTINRTRYELLASKAFARFGRLVESCIAKASLDPLDVDEVLVAGGTAHTPRVTQNLAAQFPPTTSVVAPATDPHAVNPSELAVRGAALQAFLVASFDAEDIEQSTHPMVTVTPHLARTIGFVVDGAASAFVPVIPAETPLPVRRTVNFTAAAPSDAGVLIRLCEGVREIRTLDPPAKDAAKGRANGADADSDEEEDEDEDEEEPLREKHYALGATLGELALRNVAAGKQAKVTLQVSVSAEMEVTVSAMEVGSGRPGVRGVVVPPADGAMNGKAH